VNSTIDKILSFSNNNIHNHESTTDHNLAVQCVRAAVKRKAEEDLHARPNKIIRKEIQDTNPVFKEVIVYNDIKLLRESAYRIRKKHYSKRFDFRFHQIHKLSRSIIYSYFYTYIIEMEFENR